jgi:predicted  nucleic acid-binding Zn-ribbon protein
LEAQTNRENDQIKQHDDQLRSFMTSTGNRVKNAMTGLEQNQANIVQLESNIAELEDTYSKGYDLEED